MYFLLKLKDFEIKVAWFWFVLWGEKWDLNERKNTWRTTQDLYAQIMFNRVTDLKDLNIIQQLNETSIKVAPYDALKEIYLYITYSRV